MKKTLSLMITLAGMNALMASSGESSSLQRRDSFKALEKLRVDNMPNDPTAGTVAIKTAPMDDIQSAGDSARKMAEEIIALRKEVAELKSSRAVASEKTAVKPKPTILSKKEIFKLLDDPKAIPGFNANIIKTYNYEMLLMRPYPEIIIKHQLENDPKTKLTFIGNGTYYVSIPHRKISDKEEVIFIITLLTDAESEELREAHFSMRNSPNEPYRSEVDDFDRFSNEMRRAFERGDIETLEKNGISVRLVNMHTIKPLDKEIIIQSAIETGAIVTAEEHSVIGGLGSLVATVVTENHPIPIEMVGIEDLFGQSGTPEELCKAYNIDTPDIVSAVERVIKRKMCEAGPRT
ncbi:MAG: hypothetical protein NC929_01835 [Candidatus Omnitrophica bacterium]|nr:hypothetical protein [Candidatus Omnitrophota bacterium]